MFFGIETSNLHDIALASAIEYPALSSNPNTIGVIYSTTGTRDSIIFLSSGDGGNTFSNRKIVAVTTKKFHKVALSYGRSLSQNTGRYFAVLEEQQDVGSSLGHIYTAHTEPNYNSSFTTPVKLDGLDPSLTNLCRNPSISCQTNNTDNDSANLTEVVLFEKYNASSGQHEIMFNSYDSTFNVTYFDSTSLMLPFLSKTFNMVDPDNWHLVSPGYNDDPDLRAANPKVCVNQVTHQAITVWTKLSSAGNGISMFDATYFPPVGMLDNKLPDVPQMLRIFPNPCKNSVSVEFEIGKTEIVTIALYNMLGQSMAIMINQEYRCGQHKLVLDVSQIPVGIYFVTFSTKDFSNSRKLCILR